ncbi:MAG: peptidyl-prolyl cis-trans isomerase [Holophagales bacterium]|nr:peptidyl-prolyl cis-trans isomerase [Holophagales bacterium]
MPPAPEFPAPAFEAPAFAASASSRPAGVARPGCSTAPGPSPWPAPRRSPARGPLRPAAGSLLLLLLACADSGTPERRVANTGEPRAADPETVAAFEGGRITRAQLDGEILALPPQERDAFGAENLDAYRELIRELALDALLLDEARKVGFESSPTFASHLEEMRRQVLVQQVLLESPPSADTPTEAEVKARYESSIERFGEPEQRFALTIFRRRLPGDDPTALIEEVEDLRKRVLGGEAFAVLAEKHSDSESRHMKGALGWVRRGQLPPELEEILFGLEEGVPSEPILTPEGVHLFYIDTVLHSELPSLEDASEEIRQSMLRERRMIALQEMVIATELPDGAFVPDSDQLEGLLRETDPRTVLLDLDGFVLTLDDLRQRVARESGRAEDDVDRPAQLARAIWNGLRQREVLHHRFRSEGQELTPEIRRRFEKQAESFLVERYTDHLIEEEIDRRMPELEAFYDQHRNRFVTPLELRLEALIVPHGDSPARVMAALEEKRAALEAGRMSLDELAKQVGGELQESSWVDLDTLGAFRAKAAYFAPRTQAGSYSPPYNTGRSIEIFRVLERREPRPLGFEPAREKVRDAYRELRGQELYQQLTSQRLEAAGFEIVEAHLAGLASGRAPVQGEAAAGAPESQ